MLDIDWLSLPVATFLEMPSCSLIFKVKVWVVKLTNLDFYIQNAWRKRRMAFVDERLLMPAPLVSVIVVSYNTREMTLDCLRSVVAETQVPYELIVIDNASDDGSVEAISSEFPDVHLMVETKNHGFAKANNIAAEKAMGEYILLLNPDTLVLDGAIDTLIEFSREITTAKIWGGRTLCEDRRLNPTNCWRRMGLWGLLCQALGLSSLFRNSALFNSEGYGGWKRDSAKEVDIVTGCFLLIKRVFWEQLGGFDLTFVMYGEEADLCLRARKNGARPIITPLATIVHFMGASEKVRADKMVRLLRAKMTLIDRHFSVLARPAGKMLLYLWPATRLLAYRFLARFGGKSKADTTEADWREVWCRRVEWKSGYPRY